MDIFKVQLTRKTEKELHWLPQHIVLKLAAWVEDVGRIGLSEVRKIPGYHDEPLKGNRQAKGLSGSASNIGRSMSLTEAKRSL